LTDSVCQHVCDVLGVLLSLLMCYLIACQFSCFKKKYTTKKSTCVFQECQNRANEGQFRLRDLLAVPMQRILKYHLLLAVCIQLKPVTCCCT